MFAIARRTKFCPCGLCRRNGPVASASERLLRPGVRPVWGGHVRVRARAPEAQERRPPPPSPPPPPPPPPPAALAPPRRPPPFPQAPPRAPEEQAERAQPPPRPAQARRRAVGGGDGGGRCPPAALARPGPRRAALGRRRWAQAPARQRGGRGGAAPGGRRGVQGLEAGRGQVRPARAARPRPPALIL